MRTFVVLSAALLAAFLAPTAQASLLYHYTFDVDATSNSGTGSAVATAQGTPTITAGGFSGSYAAFDGGDVAGSDAVDVNISGDAFSFGNFSLSFHVNESGAAR